MMKIKKGTPLIDQHNKNGYWGGKFGGNFIPETLKKPVEALTILFDSKGYEKSIGFDHSLINNLKLNTKIMIAGDIKYNDELDKFSKIADIIDMSGGLETLGQKDVSKIDIFLKNLNKLKNEN